MPHHTNVTPIFGDKPQALEFFAGVGLARMGLEQAGFQVVWANDYEPDKQMMYSAHFRDEEKRSEHVYEVGDVFDVDHGALPAGAAIAWGSSPCTDLSLAGTRGGIRVGESNAFWGYIKALEALGKDRPSVVVLENVVGLATSHGGDDLAAAIRAFNEIGYSVDVLLVDARRFIPQSRPRIFLVGAMIPPEDTDNSVSLLRPPAISWVFEDASLRTHRAALPAPPELLTAGLADVVEAMPDDDPRWWNGERTQAFTQSLSAIQSSRVEALLKAPGVTYRTAYRRTRNGVAIWEVRPDEIAGCLRTARGGSSKQAMVQIGREGIRVRWMTPLEYARLMGAGEYNIQGIRESKVLFAFGDAVAVPVVAWLGTNYLMPLVRAQEIVEPVGVSVAR
jgi:DNA (cytosine-5)-methyltransferase 1